MKQLTTDVAVIGAGTAGLAAYRAAIADLVAQGAEAVVLGCTEIPLIMSDANSPLPTLRG